MVHNIFAYTEPTGDEHYPAYVSINCVGDDRYAILVRSRGDHDASTVEVPFDTLVALYKALAPILLDHLKMELARAPAALGDNDA